jgi:hypothetical protein
MALTEKGHVFSWGNNSWGQLGFETTVNSNKPKLIELNGVSIKKISCGRRHSLLLTDDGFIYAFGDNSFGQLGDENRNHLSKLEKVNHENIYSDIETYFDKNISITLSVDNSGNNVIHFWGECEGMLSYISVPIKTIHESFNKVSSYYTDIQYENNLKIGDFADPFIRNGFFSKKFEKIGERLGKGSSGKVFKVRIEPEENKFSAIKIIKEKANVEKEFFKEFTNFFFIKNIESEYFIKHFDAWFEINTDRKLTFYIEMELCDTTLRKLFDEISNDSILKKGDSLTSIGYYIASELFIEIL